MSVSANPKIHVGMDVHKDTVMVAGLPGDSERPNLVNQLPSPCDNSRRSWKNPVTGWPSSSITNRPPSGQRSPFFRRTTGILLSNLP